MNLAKIVALSCIFWGVTAPSGHAQYTQPGGYPAFNPAPYLQWCDQVDANLRPAIRMANMLFVQNRFTESKAVLVQAFQRATSGMNLPGTFRPNSFRELTRSLTLIQALEASGTPASNLKSKMLAYVALNRAEFVLRVKNTLDRPFVIPCAGGGCGGYGYQRAYGTPAADVLQFETTLAGVAADQLAFAQGYSTLVRGRIPSVIPMVDAETYFTIVSHAAQWAAEDLSNLLFGQMFACSILQLQEIGGQAQAYAAALGDPVAVQFVYSRLEYLRESLRERPYCGHPGHRHDRGYDGAYEGGDYRP